MNEDEGETGTFEQTRGPSLAENKFSSAESQNCRDEYIVWTRDRCTRSEKPSTGNTFQKRQADDTSTRYFCQEVPVKHRDSGSHFRSPVNNQETRIPLSDSRKRSHPVFVQTADQLTPLTPPVTPSPNTPNSSRNQRNSFLRHFVFPTTRPGGANSNGQNPPLTPPTTPKTGPHTPTSTSNLLSFSPIQPRHFVFAAPSARSSTAVYKAEHEKTPSSVTNDEYLKLPESRSGEHAFRENNFKENPDYEEMPWKSFSLQAPPGSKTKYHHVQLEADANKGDPRAAVISDMYRRTVSSFKDGNKDTEVDSSVECHKKRSPIAQTNDENNNREFLEDKNIIDVPIPADSRFNSNIDNFTKDTGLYTQSYDKSSEIMHPLLSTPSITSLDSPENVMYSTTRYIHQPYIFPPRRCASSKHSSVAHVVYPKDCAHSIGRRFIGVPNHGFFNRNLDETDSVITDKCKRKRCESQKTESVLQTTQTGRLSCSARPQLHHDSIRSYDRLCTNHQAICDGKTARDITFPITHYEYSSPFDQTRHFNINVQRHLLTDEVNCRCDVDVERCTKSHCSNFLYTPKSAYERKISEIYELINMAKQTTRFREYTGSSCTSECKCTLDTSSKKNCILRPCPNRFKMELCKDITTPALLNPRTHESVWIKPNDSRLPVDSEYSSCIVCTKSSATSKDRCKRRLFDHTSDKVAGERRETLTHRERKQRYGQLQTSDSMCIEPKIKERKLGYVDVGDGHYLSHSLETDESFDFTQPTIAPWCACAEVEEHILRALCEEYSNIRCGDNVNSVGQFHENINRINESVLSSLDALRQMKQFCRNCSENI